MVWTNSKNVRKQKGLQNGNKIWTFGIGGTQLQCHDLPPMTGNGLNPRQMVMTWGWFVIHPHDFITKLSPPPVLWTRLVRGASSWSSPPSFGPGVSIPSGPVPDRPAAGNSPPGMDPKTMGIRKTRWNYGKLGGSHGDLHRIYHDIWQWGCVWLRLTNQNLRALKQPNNKHQMCDVRPFSFHSKGPLMTTSGWSQKHIQKNTETMFIPSLIMSYIPRKDYSSYIPT